MEGGVGGGVHEPSGVGGVLHAVALLRFAPLLTSQPAARTCMHMDAQQLIGGGLSARDGPSEGSLGMWPWLSSCSFPARAAHNEGQFLSRRSD